MVLLRLFLLTSITGLVVNFLRNLSNIYLSPKQYQDLMSIVFKSDEVLGRWCMKNLRVIYIDWIFRELSQKMKMELIPNRSQIRNIVHTFELDWNGTSLEDLDFVSPLLCSALNDDGYYSPGELSKMKIEVLVDIFDFAMEDINGFLDNLVDFYDSFRKKYM